ncbi:hypothetical protein [Streptomyces nymphaeiformis]|uniref:Uncharacterized protein n=1 Tax=Streptomyces nymphaeiformis TaxID=2663842 RepID=A0A7W7TXE8_9ACTN|nr:hypothetical protein [Streptomyces nymphaeiformis]MBB4981111.1 hypothetical protein [Streptomyces nymphaeiformis]
MPGTSPPSYRSPKTFTRSGGELWNQTVGPLAGALTRTGFPLTVSVRVSDLTLSAPSVVSAGGSRKLRLSVTSPRRVARSWGTLGLTETVLADRTVKPGSVGDLTSLRAPLTTAAGPNVPLT